MDFRQKELREEVFLRFYEFHLRYRAHPGAVYYVMPYLRTSLEWTVEQSLWFAYINGNTQNPVTSYIIFNKFPDVASLDLDKFRDWFHKPSTYRNLQWDSDRRYHKIRFVDYVANYVDLLAERPQAAYFGELCQLDETTNFQVVWNIVRNCFDSFGRLSTFSYLEYLRIMGLPIDCDTLFLRDIKGSRSHRNGMCMVVGRDDLDHHASNPSFNGKYSEPILQLLEVTGERLLNESKARAVGQPWERDVSYFTLESALCTYKSWHRPNRRYPNVYNDLFHDRIVHAEQRWLNPRLDIMWDARKESLPSNLRLEDNPLDVGVNPIKQNHYRLTGEVIMMEQDWPCFKNTYSDKHITV